ncbi:MAG TPA: hypothetical protein VNA26_07985 [Chitinophagaceae bacterium]|nr:hypothetical protein [Chitinophagaceae bacterium]
MTFYNFVFSNKPGTRFYRHFVFWFTWLVIYSFIQALRRVQFLDYGWWEAIWFSFFEMALQLPIDILLVYIIIYVFIPKFLNEDKLLLFFTSWIGAVVCIAIIQYYYVHLVVLPIRSAIGKPIPQQPGMLLAVLSTSLSYNVEAGFAASIRFIKTSIQQKKESEALKKELSLLNTGSAGSNENLDAFFFTKLVKSIHVLSLKDNKNVLHVTNKTNNLLIYILYDCKNKLVKVIKEVNALLDFVAIQNETRPTPYILHIEQRLDNGQKTLAPFLLLPLISLFFTHEEAETEPGHLHINIDEANDKLVLRIECKNKVFPMPEPPPAELLKIRNRLALIYPEGFELNKIIKNETYIILLKIDLDKIVYK